MPSTMDPLPPRGKLFDIDNPDDAKEINKAREENFKNNNEFKTNNVSRVRFHIHDTNQFVATLDRTNPKWWDLKHKFRLLFAPWKYFKMEIQTPNGLLLIEPNKNSFKKRILKTEEQRTTFDNLLKQVRQKEKNLENKIDKANKKAAEEELKTAQNELNNFFEKIGLFPSQQEAVAVSPSANSVGSPLLPPQSQVASATSAVVSTAKTSPTLQPATIAPPPSQQPVSVVSTLAPTPEDNPWQSQRDILQSYKTPYCIVNGPALYGSSPQIQFVFQNELDRENAAKKIQNQFNEFKKKKSPFGLKNPLIQSWQRNQEEGKWLLTLSGTESFWLLGFNSDSDNPKFKAFMEQEQKRKQETLSIPFLSDQIPQPVPLNPSIAPSAPSPVLSATAALQPSAAAAPQAATSLSINPAEEPYEEEAAVAPSAHGNKSQGLEQVRQIVADMKMKGIVVPEHFGIEHQSVFAFLKSYLPDLEEKWRALNNAFTSAQDPIQFMNNPATIQQLASIRAEITQAFDMHGDELEQANLSSWLQNRNNSFLMVRSDSAEDSKKFTNAGGNLSEAYVPADLKLVASSCGRVIASYFGEVSLVNQIQAKQNPFTTLPQLSVILHDLVGEQPILQANLNQAAKQPVANLPISVVLFTDEPDFSGKEKDFKVTKMSCSYGHGEAVVNTKGIATDTIYVTNSQAQEKSLILYKNNSKPKRLAPVENNGRVTLEPVDNPQHAVKKRALDRKMIDRLHDLSKTVEAKMGGPMDMELVIKGDVIYIVQMRPVIRESINPQHLEKPEHAVQKTINAKTLCTGNELVLEINDPSEILISSSLDTVVKEKLFQPGKHKLILVGKDETSTNSHGIVVAKGYNIPCFYCDEQEARKLKAQIKGNVSLVADQSEDEAQLLLWDKSKASVQEHLKPGYFSHPAPMSISLGKDPVRKSAIYDHTMPPELKEALRSLKMAKNQKVANKALMNLKQQTVGPLQARIQKLEAIATSPAAKTRFSVLQKLDHKINRTFAELSVIHQREDFDKTPLTRLFPLKTLSTLLGSSSEKALNTFTFSDMETLNREIERIHAYEQGLASPQFSGLLHFGDLGMSAADNQAWEAFLEDLEKANLPLIQIEEFKEMITSLDDMGTLPAWLNLIAMPLIKQGESSPINLQKLLSNYQKERVNLDKIIKLTHDIEALEGSVADFADPQTFHAAMVKLQEVAKQFQSWERMMEKSKITKIVFANAMGKFTAVADDCIKSMKGSAAFGDQEKVDLLNSMLKMNFEVLSHWMKQSFKGKSSNYLKELQAAWNQILANSQDPQVLLNPTPDWSVAAAIIGNTAADTQFIRHAPKTLEDLFTLIHQNQLATIAKFNHSALSDADFNTLDLPPILTEVITGLADKDGPLKNNLFERTLCTVSEKNTYFSYNIPLGQHSMMIEFEIPRKQTGDPEVIMSIKFFGENGETRWFDIARLIKAFSSLKLVQLKGNLSPTDQEVQFSLKLNYNQNIQTLFNVIACMVPIADRGRHVNYKVQKTLSKFSEEERLNIGEAICYDDLPVHHDFSVMPIFTKEFLASPRAPVFFDKLKQTYAKSDDEATIYHELMHLRALNLVWEKEWGINSFKNQLMKDLILRYASLNLSKENLNLYLLFFHYFYIDEIASQSIVSFLLPINIDHFSNEGLDAFLSLLERTIVISRSIHSERNEALVPTVKFAKVALLQRIQQNPEGARGFIKEAVEIFKALLENGLCLDVEDQILAAVSDPELIRSIQESIKRGKEKIQANKEYEAFHQAQQQSQP